MKTLRHVLTLFIAALSIFITQISLTRSAPSSPPMLAGCPLLPADNVWNVPVDMLPVDPNSNAYINAIGSTTNVHADFGSGPWLGYPIGIPYTTVLGSQAKSTVTFQYWDESDYGPYPIPPNVPIEGNPNGNGDRHILIVDQTNCVLYELYAAHKVGSQWHAGSGAIFTLTQNAPLRPDGWTSADAAGLPILPGLARYDEVASGEINHALRFTADTTQDAYIWPARHKAGSTTATNFPPMGQRFRLKASFSIDNSFSHDAQVILRALKKYGLILADNGSSWYISGAPDPHWDNGVLHELDVVTGDDFEAIDESSLMINPDSGQAIQGFNLSVNPIARSIDPGGSAKYQLAFQASGGFAGSITLTASSPSPSVTLSLSFVVITPSINVTLTLTDTHPIGLLQPGVYYSIPITATGAGITRTASIGLLIGGWKVYLPFILKNQ